MTNKLTPEQERVALASVEKLFELNPIWMMGASGDLYSYESCSDFVQQNDNGCSALQRVMNTLNLTQDDLLPELKPCPAGSQAEYFASGINSDEIVAKDWGMLRRENETKLEFIERWNRRA